MLCSHRIKCQLLKYDGHANAQNVHYYIPWVKRFPKNGESSVLQKFHGESDTQNRNGSYEWPMHNGDMF